MMILALDDDNNEAIISKLDTQARDFTVLRDESPVVPVPAQLFSYCQINYELIKQYQNYNWVKLIFSCSASN